ALIRVPTLPPGTEALPFAKSMPDVGQIVHSVGVPGATSLWGYAQGAVRSIHQKKWILAPLELDAEVIETQSPTVGESGAPLVNGQGELVGVKVGGSAAGQVLSTFVSLKEARDFVERAYQRKLNKAWSPAGRAASPQGAMNENRHPLDGRWVISSAVFQGHDVPAERLKEAFPSELV